MIIVKCMHFNSVYNKEIFRVLIMRRQNADLNKGVDFTFNLIAVYLKLVKNSLRVTQMKNYKIIYFQIPCMVRLLEIGINNF